MKIIITGSLGNISGPLTEQLVKAGHDVTVVSSSANKKADIEKFGASAAIGSVEDIEFLTKTFYRGRCCLQHGTAAGNFQRLQSLHQENRSELCSRVKSGGY